MSRLLRYTLGFEQWRPDYPTRETILKDIAQNMGYTFVDEQGIIGYCCIIIGDEPAYRQIEGACKTNRPYAVIHRMAFNKKARGGGPKLAYEWDNELPVYRGDGKASRASGRSVRFLKKKMDFVEKGGKKIDLLPPFS